MKEIYKNILNSLKKLRYEEKSALLVIQNY